MRGRDCGRGFDPGLHWQVRRGPRSVAKRLHAAFRVSCFRSPSVLWAARWLVQCGNDLGVISVTCNYFRSVIAARRSLVTETELRTASVDVLLLRIVNDYFNGV